MPDVPAVDLKISVRQQTSSKEEYIGADEFTFSVYPASTPIYMELVKNGAVADLMEAGAIVKTAFCGPCFGAGDTPANNAFSIRHSTRNFPNREGSKLQNGQIASVALDGCTFYCSNSSKQRIPDTGNRYGCRDTRDRNITLIRTFMQTVYLTARAWQIQVVEIKFGPNIKDWPEMSALPENLVLESCI